MSLNWNQDIKDMHSYFGVNDKVKTMDNEKLREFLKFRFKFLREELEEGEKAIAEGDAEGILDALIDLCVVSIGTLDAFDADAQDAWDEVYRANMNKKVGIKASRPNPFGLPDLIKPVGWKEPDHSGKCGLLTQAVAGTTEKMP